MARTFSSRIIATGSLLGALLMVPGCASPVGAVETQSAPSRAISQELVDLINYFKASGELTEMQKSILADNWVTDEEMATLADKEAECIDTLAPDGLSYVTQFGNRMWIDTYDEFGEIINQISATCTRAIVGPIRMLHRNMDWNPESLHPFELFRRCLVDTGVKEVADLDLTEFAHNLSSDWLAPFLDSKQCGTIEIDGDQITVIFPDF